MLDEAYVSEERNILVIVLDICLANDIIREGNIKISEYLDAVVAFVNFYLLLKSTNKVAVIVTDSVDCKLVYPDEVNNSIPGRQLNGQCEASTEVEQTLRNNISQFIIKNASNEIKNVKPLIGAAGALSLCYIARLAREKQTSCVMNSRILFITGCDKDCDKYIRIMNLIFAAQKCNVTIDVCSLMYDIEVLQKACDITEGVFFKITNVNGLFQYLMSIFLPDPSTRKKMLALVPRNIDYRPFCYCHKEIIDLGYVCSVCLSVFCKFTPICTTCEVLFKGALMNAVRYKKKKIKTT